MRDALPVSLSIYALALRTAIVSLGILRISIRTACRSLLRFLVGDSTAVFGAIVGNRSTANSAILLGELGILSLDDEELLEKRKGIFPKLASRIRPIQELLDARSRLKLRLHNLSNAKFDSSQKEHLELLKQLWTSLRPGIRFPGTVSREWTEIGFQGQDPASDFRGLGLLALISLVYFAEENATAAKVILEKSTAVLKNPGYALEGISMGSYTKRLIEQGSVDVFIVHQLNVDSLLHSSLGKNDSSHYQEIQPYLQLLCHYWADFDRFWSWANPPTIMSFEKIHQIFHLRFLLSSEYESFRKFLSAICCR